MLKKFEKCMHFNFGNEQVFQLIFEIKQKYKNKSKSMFLNTIRVME